MLFSRSLAPALRATALRATARVAVRPSAAPAMQLQKRMFGHSDFDPISTADSSKSAIEQIEHVSCRKTTKDRYYPLSILTHLIIGLRPPPP